MDKVQPLGDDAIVTADNYGPPLREMCEIRFNPELTMYMSETELFDLAEKFFDTLRSKYIPNLPKDGQN